MASLIHDLHTSSDMLTSDTALLDRRSNHKAGNEVASSTPCSVGEKMSCHTQLVVQLWSVSVLSRILQPKFGNILRATSPFPSPPERAWVLLTLSKEGIDLARDIFKRSPIYLRQDESLVPQQKTPTQPASYELQQRISFEIDQNSCHFFTQKVV
jgi:hypothetical protein